VTLNRGWGIQGGWERERARRDSLSLHRPQHCKRALEGRFGTID